MTNIFFCQSAQFQKTKNSNTKNSNAKKIFAGGENYRHSNEANGISDQAAP